mgnify:CR=1 FL=1
MKNIKGNGRFLTLTAIFECATAIALLAAPQTFILLLFEVALNEPIAILVAQIAGAALFTIAIACWQSRNFLNEPLTFGLLQALLFYNIAVALLLVYGAMNYSLISAGVLLVTITHFLFAVWCAIILWQHAGKSAKTE